MYRNLRTTWVFGTSLFAVLSWSLCAFLAIHGIPLLLDMWQGSNDTTYKNEMLAGVCVLCVFIAIAIIASLFLGGAKFA
ncbi:MAG: hypothetical protein LBE09_03445 [Christensenellaceae bacterium]|nr:hypothetical protein [Christensenellaceae bacterium]